MAKPNFLFLFCDQMRGDAWGADGNPAASTPHLDALAARGTRFRHAYSAVPSCLPSRAILWTGQNQWHAGLLGMGDGQGHIPNDYPHTLAGELTRAGYRTHLVGKGHFHPQRTSMGFESAELDESGRMPDSDHRQWFAANAPPGVTPDDHGIGLNGWQARPWHTDPGLHPTAWTMDRALDFLRRRDAARPFFLNISFARPHSPYVPPEEFFRLHEGRALPQAVVGDWVALHEEPEGATRSPDAWRGRMTEEEIRRARTGYYGEISFIDAQVGRLLGFLDTAVDAEERARTWIVFASDHGDMLGDHHLWRKTYAFEGSARIPLLIVPPPGRTPARSVADEVVELRDLMPTILDLAGLPCPRTVDGRSLAPLLDREATAWRPYLHGEHCTSYHPAQEMQYVTDGRRKFIWLPRIGAELFFDLEADPGELHNLAADPTRNDEVARWRGALIRELDARRCGWVVDGRLVCPDDQPLVSPYRDVRWLGSAA